MKVYILIFKALDTILIIFKEIFLDNIYHKYIYFKASDI